MKRRQFVQASAISTFSILPSGLWANSPNGKLRSAHIAVGGKGSTDTGQTARHEQVEVAAICDVDSKTLAGAKKRYPEAKAFRDYRELFATMGDSIDIVTVSTPDHVHAAAAMMAMNLGKAVYCQKPLTHTIFEARALANKAKETGVSTQMGIQNQSRLEYRWATALIQSGVLGKIKRVHSWSFKRWGYDGGIPEAAPAPETLDWDQWIGTATMRPYAEGIYHPKNWRKMVDFGTGTMGDMGIHILDPPMLNLGLSAPLSVKAECRPPNGIGHPMENTIEFNFAGTEYTDGPLTLIWTDGKIPSGHEDLAMPDGEELPKQGSIFVGEEGRMLLPHVSSPRFLPEEKFDGVKFPRVEKGDHYEVWIDKHLGKEANVRADFAYSSMLTESVLVGGLACRFPGQTLNWDSEALRVTNIAAANAFLKRQYRAGFEVEGLS